MTIEYMRKHSSEISHEHSPKGSWDAQMNELGKHGWVLCAIDDRYYIFQRSITSQMTKVDG